MILEMAEASSGPWSVEHVTVSARQSEEEKWIAKLTHDPDRWTPPGVYTVLRKDGVTWMSDAPPEVHDHQEVLDKAVGYGGRVLVHGLGLGLILRDLLLIPTVDTIDVVELDMDVIKLVGPSLRWATQSGRLTIYYGDCRKLHWNSDVRWSVIWHDIWPTIDPKWLPEMDELERLFRCRCEWQACWGRDWLEADRPPASAGARYVPD